MYLARLALDALWHDNVTIIHEFDLVDAERLVKQFFDSGFELYKSGVHTTIRNTLGVTYCYVSCRKGRKKNIPSKSIYLGKSKEKQRLSTCFKLSLFSADEANLTEFQLYIN